MSDEGRLVGGRYRLDRRIGSGAMGVVWQAYDERLHRAVAVKQLRLDRSLEPDEADEARERAMREGRIAARLHHPNAVAVFDVVDEDDAPWLVMEYLPSRSLAAEMTERGVLTPEEVSRIGAQIAHALAAAHAAGIVHRDIKPANVLLGDNGSVKITDFGISRATGDVAVTKTGLIAGTPAYLAPEVAYGRNPEAPSDVFSLGSTLYAAVEGQPPFGLSENTLGLLHAVAAGRIQAPQRAGALTDVLIRLLDADPDRRPTAATAARWLDSVSHGEPVMLEPPADDPTALMAERTTVTSPAAIKPPIMPTSVAGAPGGQSHQWPNTGFDEQPSNGSRRRPIVLAGIGLVAVVGLAVALLASGVWSNHPTTATETSSQTVPTTLTTEQLTSDSSSILPTTTETTNAEPTHPQTTFTTRSTTTTPPTSKTTTTTPPTSKTTTTSTTTPSSSTTTITAGGP